MHNNGVNGSASRNRLLEHAISSTFEVTHRVPRFVAQNEGLRHEQQRRKRSRDHSADQSSASLCEPQNKKRVRYIEQNHPQQQHRQFEASSPAAENDALPLDMALVAFLRAVASTPRARDEALRVLSDLNSSLNALGIRVHIFGSWRTGLWIPTSDMDFVAVPCETAPADGKPHIAAASSSSAAAAAPSSSYHSSSNSTGSRSLALRRLAIFLDDPSLPRRERQSVFGGALRVVANNLRSSRLFCVDRLILHAKVPIVKAQHRPSRTKVDISFHEDGLHSSEFLCSELKRFRIARGLIMLVKGLVANWHLDDPSVGGLGSFPIAIMTLWFLRTQVEERFPLEWRESYAVCLVGFLRFYGEELNYKTTGIDYANLCTLSKPVSSELCVMNPLVPNANCAVAATLFATRVVPKFRETIRILLPLLKDAAADSSVERTVLSLFGTSVAALGGAATVQRAMRQEADITFKKQHLWDSRTQFYVGDVLGS